MAQIEMQTISLPSGNRSVMVGELNQMMTIMETFRLEEGSVQVQLSDGTLLLIQRDWFTGNILGIRHMRVIDDAVKASDFDGIMKLISGDGQRR